ncbi:PorP/SprF family type IX secretion system membrane protein [Rufibacter psychrotolerans]|uniref:PorP/SprF family type IX secretion system membrane protein n=1 Tax=Rufibacter psychrotolerans TaxID=2812556 RepID=UPI00196784F1|nr:PorP/SprF family type IX secretion system membrane protein [Rufibacter sp. SYSU D00308]
MKKLTLSICFLLSVLGVSAQNRKHIANFSLFQQYFNPALTGYEGSMVKTFYRNQWTGFEDAPRTIFASVELDQADLSAWRKADVLKTRETDAYSRQAGAKHAWGLSVLHDSFGPFAQTQVNLSYGSRIRLSESLSLRVGVATTYDIQRLNGNKLVVDQEGDQEFAGYLGTENRVSKFDVNLGAMLTGEDFYVGYALQDITKGALSSGDAFMEGTYTIQHVVQAGYRTALSEQVGLVANGIFRYDSHQKETTEVQAKAVFQNIIWAGAGYRHNLAYTLNAGLRLNQFRVGYVHEIPTGDAAIKRNTSEFMVTYNLLPVKYPKLGKKVTMW